MATRTSATRIKTAATTASVVFMCGALGYAAPQLHQPSAKVLPDTWPIEIGNRIEHAVANVTCPGDPLASQYTFLYRAQFCNGGLAAHIAKVSQEFYPLRTAAEGMLKHQVL